MFQSRHALSVLAAAWLAGLLCALASGAVGGVWAVLGVFAAASLLALRAATGVAGEPGSPVRSWPLWLLAALSWAAGASVPLRLDAALPLPPAGPSRLVAVVEECAALTAGEARCVLRVVNGARLQDGAPVASDTWLSAGPVDLPTGATVRVLAKLSPRQRFRNPTPHPLPPPRFELQGHAWVTDPHAFEVLDRSVFWVVIEAVRARVRERLEQTLPPRVAGIARALVLGDDRALDPLDVEQVRAAGLLHVFAVSGLHVVILAGLLVELLQWVMRRTALVARFCVRRLACAAGVPLVLVYALFAGGSPSAWRAAITAAVAWLLVACGRRPDAIATAAASVLVWGGLSPEAAVRPAFLLSIAATSAILDGRFGAASDVAAWLRDAFALSARTALATAPIALWFFGGLPLCGVLANVVLLPFGSLLLVQLSALHALSCTLTPWGALTAAPFVVVSDAFVAACAQFARLGPALRCPPPDVAQGLVIAAGAAALMLSRRIRTRAVLLVVMLGLLAGLEWHLRVRERPRGELRVTFVDVGQGDAALLDLPDGRLMMIDAGGNPGGGPDPGRAVLLPLLAARRRESIDIAVLTHPHPDHFGGFAALLPTVPVAELWDSGQAGEEAELDGSARQAMQLIEAARKRGTRVLGPGQLCGAPRDFGGARVQVLAPCPAHDPSWEPNDNSLVVRVAYGRRVFLFAGDAEQAAETRLLERPGELRADVLKVGHHGSRTSSGEAFVRAVAPWLAIISAGATNRFGHPSPEVVARLRAARIEPLRLDREGGTIVRSDGQTLSVQPWSGRTLELPMRPPSEAPVHDQAVMPDGERGLGLP